MARKFTKKGLAPAEVFVCLFFFLLPKPTERFDVTSLPAILGTLRYDDALAT